MRTVVNISLPEPLNQLVDQMVKRGRYSTKSEFVRELIREKAEEENILRQVEKSESEFRAGKGKVLRSLKDLR